MASLTHDINNELLPEHGGDENTSHPMTDIKLTNEEMKSLMQAISYDELHRNDSIHAPLHYIEGRIYEPRKVIHDWGLNFNLGNAVKYIARAGRKGDIIEDLKKAKQYLEFEIEELEDERRV